MPGSVVDFGHGEKEKATRKAAPCLKIFTCILSNLMIDYEYVARHGCLPMWCRQRFRRPRIEIIIFLVTEKERVRCLIFPARFLYLTPQTDYVIISLRRA